MNATQTGGRPFYTLSQPPRAVPLMVRSKVLFGGFLNLFGWVFFGFGLIFFWVFAMNADLGSFFHFRGEPETAPGVVLQSRATGASENKRKVYAVDYSFTAHGAQYQGMSYSTGERPSPKDPVTVEFVRGNPSISRVQGMRRAMFSGWAAFVCVFPLVGLVFVVFGLKSGFRANHLLANGKVGFATLKSKTPTNTRVNNQTVHKLTFELVADTGNTYEVTAKTHRPEVLEDEAKEVVLYDPQNPSYAVMLDSLPGGPEIDEMGNIRSGSLFRGLLLLAAPAATITGHGTYIYFAYFR